MATAKKPAAPLTAAQVEVVQQLIEDRQERLVSEVEKLIAAQIDALFATHIAPLDAAAVKYGAKLALRSAGGKLLGAKDGGPAIDEQPFEIVAKTSVGPHESFTTERGQG